MFNNSVKNVKSSLFLLDKIINNTNIKEKPNIWKNQVLNVLSLSEHVSYTSPEIILLYKNVLLKSVLLWHVFYNKDSYGKLVTEAEAKLVNTENIASYPLLDKTFFKNFQDTSCNNTSVFRHDTSGSSGYTFFCLSWKDAFWIVENNNHYGKIRREFELENSVTLATLMPCYDFTKQVREPIFVQDTDKVFFAVVKSSSNFFYSFNVSEFVDIVYNINKPTYYKSMPLFFEFFSKKNCDVFNLRGSFIKILARYVKDKNIATKVGKLLCNTFESVDENDLFFLKDRGIFDNVCDHMRCCDGGGTFFTCKFGTYHLMEEVCHAISINEKFVSTDFFNFVWPFINYWNNDTCQVEDNWFKCECGRWYRPFKFCGRSSFVFKDKNLREITSADISERCLHSATSYYAKVGLIQYQCYNGKIVICTSEKVKEQHKSYLRKILYNFNVDFKTNEFIVSGQYNKVNRMVDCTKNGD